MWRRRRRSPQGFVPEGVRIEHADGRCTPCSVFEDPERGLRQWMVIPDFPVVIDADAGDRIRMDYQPPGLRIIMWPVQIYGDPAKLYGWSILPHQH